jgi:alkylation response protein AidB-like acyl-CoA dehydrogenase
MGIHGNATCQMTLDGAVGTLVGEPHKGLAAMFVMMNAARLGVGNQSLGLTEVAYQNALAYAKDRIQMRSAVRPQGQGQAGRPHHRAPRRAQDAAHRQAPTPKAAARWQIYCALLLDKEHHSHPDEKTSARTATTWWRC